VFSGTFARRMARTFTTRSLGRLCLLEFLLRHSALVDGKTGPQIKTDEQPLLLLADRRSEVQVPPARAGDNDT
jgi:hypothetical protein